MLLPELLQPLSPRAVAWCDAPSVQGTGTRVSMSEGHQPAAAVAPVCRGSGLLSQPLYLPEQVQILSKQLGDRPGSPQDIDAPTQLPCFDVSAGYLTHLVFNQEGEMRERQSSWSMELL